MIEIEGLWKQYKLGNTVDLNRSFRETLSEKFSSPKRSSASPDPQSFWALRDIDLSVPEGKSLGLIGHNGAGKSTLLKVLSRITKPTKGRIKMAGSLSSLLEVGTGFHPELSGRENVFLYGSIMGMSRHEIQSKFDDIVSYAGIEKFIDTPVKRYSSGMYVRLAFSIAAHVEPDILIVDEVLAVGDKSFRERCLGKMDDVAQSGRTVIFVSHNMNAVASLCQEVAWLDRGSLKLLGPTHHVISEYENSIAATTASERAQRLLDGNLAGIIKLESLKVQQQSDAYHLTVRSDSEVEVEATWKSSEDLQRVVMNLGVFSGGVRLFTLQDVEEPTEVRSGFFTSKFVIPADVFNNAEISLAIGGKELIQGRWCWATDVVRITTVADGLNAVSNEEDSMICHGSGSRSQQ